MKHKEYTPPVYIGQNLYIRPTYIVSMPEYYFENGGRSVNQLNNAKNLKSNSHGGQMSAKAQTNIKNAINWLLISAQKKRVYSKTTNKAFSFKVNFVTLTLPDTGADISHSDFTKKLLNPFLVYLRKYHSLKNYVWKIELHKSGKIHCHLTCDSFIHWRDLRRVWNLQVSRAGYMAQFRAKFGHSNPNSTDVHSVYKVRNLGAYLAKYLAKSSQGQEKLTGKLWGCNYELSRANKTRVHIPADQLSEHLHCLYKKSIEYKPIEQWDNEKKEAKKIGEIFFIKFNQWATEINGAIKSAFDDTRHTLISLARHFTPQEFYV